MTDFDDLSRMAEEDFLAAIAAVEARRDGRDDDLKDLFEGAHSPSGFLDGLATIANLLTVYMSVETGSTPAEILQQVRAQVLGPSEG